MKKKNFAALLTVCTMSALLAAPVLADDKQLDNNNTTGDTEVDATIVDAAGEVAYIVTIPQKIDFGKLTCPAADEDSFTTQKFTVNCVQMSGVDGIIVSAYNDGAAAGEANQGFYLTNQTNTSCTFKPTYDLYVGTSKIDTSGAMPVNGYQYTVFTKEGQSVTGGVRLNQRQLFPYKDDLTPIAGNYSGSMVFTTAAQ